MIQQHVNSILEKMSRLGISPAPVISPEALQAIAASLSITLPPTYVAFLTQIQNGGASDELHKNGPYYGIYSIEKSLAENEEWEVNVANHSPLISDIHFSDCYQAEADWDTHVWRYENDSAYKERVETVLDRFQHTGMLDGTLPVCEYGDGDYFRIMITGNNPGQIWVDSGVISDTGYYCLNVDILTFFERWLDRQLLAKQDPSQQLVRAWYPFLEFGSNERYQLLD
ncbi:SMI1/KNR4 family protein [Chitinophaga nivalis]|uniref:SMI1/KNR4 family protein n=1 Tax=Chitinophaga nivalis TaxID=2991709 RepID=A0ABT3INE2_9BACT|nr:SMI1/KNR4 family protein [Chitinophaga nivalis]MCW3464847.1 SMI1/KNR4 family protein [Chitinophaga nivalis]MCW3485462.1 SMI1/KNR4 family protein [Chitinophaga nivalis]